MDTKLLPASIKINFDGYRGYFEEDLELSGKHLDNGRYFLSYSHEGAEFALQIIIKRVKDIPRICRDCWYREYI